MSPTTEQFAEAREAADTKANQNTNLDEIPFYIANGRMFYGLGKDPVIVKFRKWAAKVSR
jgi:hypothetical protein